MRNIADILTEELSLQPIQVANALALREEGGTIPFIARYRKERTGEMNEIQLRALFDRSDYLMELEERKTAILKSIEEQGKLTDELRTKIEGALQKTELEDLYLPFRPKKRTRATVARERGLAPLAERIAALNVPEILHVDLEAEATPFLSAEKGVAGTDEALAGAADILAEEIAEKASLRSYLRDSLVNEGTFVSRLKEEFAVGTTKYELYRDFRVRVKDIQPHNMLALRRGEDEGVLLFDIEFDEEAVHAYLMAQEVRAGSRVVQDFFAAMLRDAFERLMKNTLIGEVRFQKKEAADIESVKTFAENLRELLLAPPAGMMPTLGVDPGFRTGCKTVVIDGTGKFIEYHTLFPHQSANERAKASEVARGLIARHHIGLIAIGNGTAGRETDAFFDEVLDGLEVKPLKVIVNESGASVYSASEVAIGEFPQLDLTIRGAISIGRRLQDPLAELVKIDPKSIGVGQYQHDVDQKLLRKKLDETVESCVNFVGVDVNTASVELLSYVAGINSGIAKNIVAYRNDRGPFRDRSEFREIPKLGPKSFEQAAGFLRIRRGNNPLDDSAVHPESYGVVSRILNDLGLTVQEAVKSPETIAAINLKRYVTPEIGEPTLRDIVSELQKPGRDPRQVFRYASFKEGVKELKDLAPGMELEGVVTNVANFGAFVDIGVHQDGLVHVSQLSDRFVADPRTVVKVGQIVSVRVLEVNEQLKRISLTMKKEAPRLASQEKGQKSGLPHKGKEKKPAPRSFTIDDLRAKFRHR
ncbi:MAG: Tex family protein [Bacteroidota bacterium]